MRLFFFRNLSPFGTKEGTERLFYGADSRFLLEEISKDEHDQIVRFTPLYLSYLRVKKYTFLPKILGLYVLQQPPERPRHFIIQKNIFPSSVGKRFTSCWHTSEDLRVPLSVGYVKKAQLMEQFELDTTVSSKRVLCYSNSLVSFL